MGSTLGDTDMLWSNLVRRGLFRMVVAWELFVFAVATNHLIVEQWADAEFIATIAASAGVPMVFYWIILGFLPAKES
jgi:hypothetical protein